MLAGRVMKFMRFRMFSNDFYASVCGHHVKLL